MSKFFVKDRDDLTYAERQRRTEFIEKLEALIAEYKFSFTDGINGAEIFDCTTCATGSDEWYENPL
jgi:hypothetical protein